MKRAILIGLVVLVVAGSVPAAALPDYYNNSTTETGQDAWVDGHEDGSLDSIIGMVTRLPSFIIGPGPAAPGSIGPSGPVLFAFVLAGTMIGATLGTGMGMVATGVLTVVAAAGITQLGLVPQWGYAVVVFIVGLLAYQALQRVIE